MVVTNSYKSEITDVDELLRSAVPPDARGPDRTRRAIVTGGDTGIGRYIALALAADGCDVAFTYAHHENDAQVTAEAIRKLGRRAVVHQMDLEQPEHAEIAVDHMVDQLGGLDIFVNNAGTMITQVVPDIDLAAMEKLFRVNTFGAVLGVQRALRHMLDIEDEDKADVLTRTKDAARKLITGRVAKPRDTPGRVIIITSTHEHVASPVDTVYTMTKHALGGLVKCGAFSTAGLNITVNALAPGEIATPINGMHPDDGLKADRDDLPAKRAGHPTEIADAVRFLASDASSFINGVSYDVDGGLAIAEPMAMAMYRAMV